MPASNCDWCGKPGRHLACAQFVLLCRDETGRSRSSQEIARLIADRRARQGDELMAYDAPDGTEPGIPPELPPALWSREEADTYMAEHADDEAREEAEWRRSCLPVPPPPKCARCGGALPGDEAPSPADTCYPCRDAGYTGRGARAAQRIADALAAVVQR